MNYLAHLFLAGDTTDSLIGNLAGDFVKGPLHDRFPPAIADGIREHRRIDAFTDAHPSVAAFRRVLIPDHGHYARVIADVFFDHFLTCGWRSYSQAPLRDFLANVYAKIDAYPSPLPGTLAIVWPRMRDGRWLEGYGHVDNVRLALGGISRRMSRRPALESAAHHLDDSRHELQRRFDAFFPDVVAFANALRSRA
jgi:acyl carrier protein phosphodiesterase